jgi:uncharacterized protein YgiB involved in biofilm formation
MLKRTRKRSAQITLILLGVAALAGCNDQDERRDLYASKQDCVKDWGDETKCESAPDSANTTGHSHSGGGFFWGPSYFGSGLRSSGASSSALSTARSGSHSIGSSSVSRGGFGSSASAHSSHSSGS